eukprot:jgi/Tetstr1/421473/TSEL_012422.t1
MGDASRDLRIRDDLSDATGVEARAEGTESLEADAKEERGGTNIIGAAGQHVANVHRGLRGSEAVKRERIRERARNMVRGLGMQPEELDVKPQASGRERA